MIRPSSKEHSARGALLVTGDFLLAWGALAAVVFMRRNVPLRFTRALLAPDKLPVDATAVILFAGSFLIALALSGFYRRRVMPRERPLIATALVLQVALIAVGGALTERPLPRTVLIGVLLLEALALPAWRALIRVALPIRRRETILVGDASHVRAALTGLAAATDARIRVVAWAGPPADAAALELPYAGRVEEATVRERLRDVEEVIFVHPEASPNSRLELLRIRGPRGYLLLASHADALLTSTMLGWVGDQPLIEIAVGCGYGLRAAIKRSVDVALGSILAVIAMPIGAIAAAAIWLDDHGPVLIRQSRVGRGGVPFAMWKFRSMTVPENGEGDGIGLTRIGGLLRRYRIDELPQLLNVITGDMSLVGPRPERPEIVARILNDVPDFDLRNLVRPGIAGLAQVSAKYDSSPEVKLRYDLTYMCDWSLLLDVRLLLSSVSASLAGSGL
ncbi:MAG: sugar transferase involved in lipopolysaccharide synthesis [Acidobacteria bacterium]|nr:sugar transferase involved in lipopolysaccharide synthesis [Acidobacteriota bacterium]